MQIFIGRVPIRDRNLPRIHPACEASSRYARCLAVTAEMHHSFETPVVVDNTIGKTILDAAE
jgi:hypothetical protein